MSTVAVSTTSFWKSKKLGEGCVVLELESKANDRLRVIEASFPADYVMSLTPRHPIL